MILEVVKFKIPISELPDSAYSVDIADCIRNVGEIVNGKLILPYSRIINSKSEVTTFTKGMAYKSVAIILIEIIDSSIEINHWCFQEIRRSNGIIRYLVR